MRRQAFTILEVTLVLAVMLVMAAIVVPSIDVMYANVRLTASSDQIRGRWAEARTRAIDDGVPYRFAVAFGSGRMRIAPDAGEFWSDSGGDSSAQTNADAPPLIVEDELTNGVIFISEGGNAGGDSDADGDWTSVVTFLPTGTANRDITIALRQGSSRPLLLRLRGLTCAVTAQFQAEER